MAKGHWCQSSLWAACSSECSLPLTSCQQCSCSSLVFMCDHARADGFGMALESIVDRVNAVCHDALPTFRLQGSLCSRPSGLQLQDCSTSCLVTGGLHLRQVFCYCTEMMAHVTIARDTIISILWFVLMLWSCGPVHFWQTSYNLRYQFVGGVHSALVLLLDQCVTRIIVCMFPPARHS